MQKKVFPILVGLFTSLAAQAVSVSFLKGNNFRDDLGYRRDKVTMTIENFSVWEYGNVFFYYDITEPFNKDNGLNNQGQPSRQPKFSNQFFGGISPTFSLTKMTGADWSFGFIKDVSIRLELENGSGNGTSNFRNYFYGLQYDLAIPGFDFAMLNTVLRDNPNDAGVGFQIGGFWQMSWDYGPWRRFKFTGFFATSPWDGDQSFKNKAFAKRGRYLTTQPQLLYDIGYGLTGKPNRIETGFEYAYFINRFQLKNKDEKALQAMVKFSF